MTHKGDAKLGPTVNGRCIALRTRSMHPAQCLLCLLLGRLDETLQLNWLHLLNDTAVV